MNDLLVTGVQFLDGSAGTLSCSGGAVVSELHASSRPEVISGDGFVALPRLVDAHVHLDKTFLGGSWYPNMPASSLAERIRDEAELLDSPAVEPVEVRAARLIERAVANGATRIRSHVDISARTGLRRLEAVLAVRERYRHIVDISLVAFPQEGIIASPGTADFMAEALSMGTEAVGGLDPATFDEDRARHLDIVFGLAERFDRDIDIHLHEPAMTGIESLEAIAGLTAAAGRQGRVCVSHAYALAQVRPEVVAHTADILATAGVAIISAAPGEGLMPPVMTLMEHGVTVAVASDNIRDSWWPYGKADPLERACTAGYIAGWFDDPGLMRALSLVSTQAARALRTPVTALQPGDAADFTLVSALNAQEAVVMQPGNRIVVKEGRIVARDGVLVAD